MIKRQRDRMGGWRRRDRKAGHVNQGDLSATRDGVHAPRSRRAGETGVRAPIRAMKGRNGPGAKGAQEGGDVTNGQTEKEPAGVPATAKQAGDIRARWAWAEPAVWTERMLTALEEGIKGGKLAERFLCRAWAVFPCDGPEARMSILMKVKPPTGEPDAGKLPVRFGGRGAGPTCPASLPLSGARTGSLNAKKR